MSGHIFVSYVRENIDTIKRLASDLRAYGFEVWIDRERLKPGARWQDAIREAIRGGDLFLACFSPEYAAKDQSYMNEELTIAVEELRRRPTDREWFIPVILNRGVVPKRAIGAGETLHDLQWVDLTDDWLSGLEAVARVAFERRVTLLRPPGSTTTPRAASSPKPAETVEERLARIDRERAVDQARKAFLESEAGVQAALREAKLLHEVLSAKAKVLAERATTLNIASEMQWPTCVIRATGYSVLVSWLYKYTNSLSESGLYVLEYERAYFLSGINLDGPKELKRTVFSFDKRENELGWSSKSEGFLSTAQLADHCFNRLLERAETRR